MADKVAAGSGMLQVSSPSVDWTGEKNTPVVIRKRRLGLEFCNSDVKQARWEPTRFSSSIRVSRSCVVYSRRKRYPRRSRIAKAGFENRLVGKRVVSGTLVIQELK